MKHSEAEGKLNFFPGFFSDLCIPFEKKNDCNDI